MDLPGLAITVASQAAGKALLAHGIPGGEAATRAILHDLIGLQDEQAAAVSRIDKNVERLIEGPWNTARLYVQEALLPSRDATQTANALTVATEKLREAVPLQEQRTIGYAFVSIDLAILLLVLADRETAVFHAREAAKAAAGLAFDVKDRKRRPPNYTTTVARGYTYATLTLSGGLLARALGKSPSVQIRKMDDTFNAWLQDLQLQIKGVFEAAIAICGPDDPVLQLLAELTPRALTYRNARLKLK
jgi:hypothetical protein